MTYTAIMRINGIEIESTFPLNSEEFGLLMEDELNKIHSGEPVVTLISTNFTKMSSEEAMQVMNGKMVGVLPCVVAWMNEEGTEAVATVPAFIGYK